MSLHCVRIVDDSYKGKFLAAGDCHPVTYTLHKPRLLTDIENMQLTHRQSVCFHFATFSVFFVIKISLLVPDK